jgi:hypothetical protein
MVKESGNSSAVTAAHRTTIESDSVAPERCDPAVAGPGPQSGPVWGTGRVTGDVTTGVTAGVAAVVSPSMTTEVAAPVAVAVTAVVVGPMAGAVKEIVTPVVTGGVRVGVTNRVKRGVTRGMTPGLTPWVGIGAQVSGPERVAESSPRRVTPERAVRLAGQATRYATARALVMPTLEAEKAAARYVVEQAALGSYEGRARKRPVRIAPGCARRAHRRGERGTETGVG